MKYIYSLSFLFFLLFACNPNPEFPSNIKRDIAITVSTEVGQGTYDLVGEATGRVNQTDAFLSVSVASYLHERSTPMAMQVLFNNFRGIFFYNPSKIRQYNKVYGKRTGEMTEASIGRFEDVTVEGGTFLDCLKQEIDITDYAESYNSDLEKALINGKRYLWFAQGVGIVKIRYEHSNGIVTEGELTDYKIVGESNDYFPLTPGTTWTYRWQDDFYKQPFMDTLTVEPRKPQREGYPLKVEVKSETGEALGSGRFEVTKNHMILMLHRGSTSAAEKYKGGDSIPGSSSIFFSHLGGIWTKLLQYPLTIGKTWENEGLYSSTVQSTLVGYETVEIGIGKFQECLKQKTEFHGATTDSEADEDTLQQIAMVNGTRYIWYAKGVGIVKVRYEHSNGVITEAEIAKYVIPKESNAYFPLDVGTTWTYVWQNEYHMTPMTEVVRVVEEGSGHETQLKNAHYEVNVSAEKPSEVQIECEFTPMEITGNRIRFRPSSDDSYIISHSIIMKDSIGRMASKTGGAGSWVFKFKDDYSSPLTVSYVVSIDNAQRIRTFRENQGRPQHLRFQTLEPDHKQDRTFWTGKALFMVGGTNRDIEVSFNLPEGWLVSTPWRQIGDDKKRFEVSSQAELIDSLLLVGRHSEVIASANNTNVTLAIAGEIQPFEGLIHETIEKYLRTYHELFKGGPDDNVLFIINPYESENQKGLEGRGIMRSVSILMDNWLDETNKHIWAPFLGHEIFHIWNGLSSMQSFSGHEHWFVEGVTNYFSDISSLHLGYLTEREYLNRIERACERYLSVSDKYAISDARDSRLSYAGGSLIAAALDFEIREHKKNRKSLNDVLRLMYKQFGNQNVEYTQSDIKETLFRVSGIDCKPFFEKYVEGKERLPLAFYFDKAGLDLLNTTDELPTIEYVKEILRESLGYTKNVEVVGLNGHRIGNIKELQKAAKHWVSGEVVALTFEENGKSIAKTASLKGISETPPTEKEIVVHITEKPEKTRLQRAILAEILGRK